MSNDREEIAKRVAAANKEKVGEKGKRQSVNSRPNRVDSDFLEPLRNQAIDFWGEAMLAFNKLTRAAIDAANDDELPDKVKRDRISNATAFNPLIKHLAQFGSGAVHPAGSNVKQEKLLAAEKVQAARDKFAAKEAEALVELAKTATKDE